MKIKKRVLVIYILLSIIFLLSGCKKKKKFEIEIFNYKSHPAISNNGKIYVGSTDKNLYALNSDGKIKWKFKTGGKIETSPVICKNGDIVFSSMDKKVYRINSKGEKKWVFKFPSKISKSPALSDNGVIYIGDTGLSQDIDEYKYLYAINPDGSLKWKYKTQNGVTTPAAIDKEGNIYFGTCDSEVVSLNPDGNVRWKLPFFTTKSPVIDDDGVIYIVFDNKLIAVSKSGKIKWIFKGKNDVEFKSPPVIDKNGNIYIGSLNKKLYSFDKNGYKNWEFETNGWIFSSPLIGSDGTIYLGDITGHTPTIYALDSNGKLLWNYQVDNGSSISCLKMNNSGILYFFAKGKLFALQTDSEGLSKGGWPEFGYNNKNIFRR